MKNSAISQTKVSFFSRWNKPTQALTERLERLEQENLALQQEKEGASKGIQQEDDFKAMAEPHAQVHEFAQQTLLAGERRKHRWQNQSEAAVLTSV